MRMRESSLHSGFTSLHLEWCARVSVSHFKEDPGHPEDSKKNDPVYKAPLLGRTEGTAGVCSTQESKREKSSSL